MSNARTPFSNDIPGVKPGVFQDEYQLMQELGRGTFSVCRLCESKTTRKQYAVKVCLPQLTHLPDYSSLHFELDYQQIESRLSRRSGNITALWKPPQYCYPLWCS